MASAASFASIIGSASSTVSGFQAGMRNASAVRAQGNYEATADTMNATLATAQSADAIARGGIAANVRGAQTRQQIGATTAQLAGSGVDLKGVSATAATGTEAFLGALDEATIRNNAARQAWGYDVQASDYTQRAALARASSTNTANAEEADAYTGLLTGAAKTYGLIRNRGTNAKTPYTGTQSDVTNAPASWGPPPPAGGR